MRASILFTSVLALTSASLLGCSGKTEPASHATTTGTDPGTGGGTTTTTSPGGSGGTTTTPTPVPYPAPHPGFPQLPKHGGDVLHDPSMVTITFAGDGFESQIQSFADQIGTLSWWPTVMDGYGVGALQNGGKVTIPDAPPANISDDEVQAWLAAKIGDGTLPAPNDQRIYFIYYPNSTTVTLQGDSSCQGFLGYHNATTVLLGAQSVVVAYAVVNRCGDIDQVTETASHELAEAATDPNPTSLNTMGYGLVYDTAWTMLGGENADMCSGVSSVSEGGWSLTRVWNNKTAAIGQQPCVPAPDSAIPFFDGAIVKDLLQANPGDTVSTEVDCYSFGPLPSPINLSARANSKSALTITFDKDTCVNGDKVTMSIAVSPTAKSATNYHYTLEASLDANTGHLWRGMVHVK